MGYSTVYTTYRIGMFNIDLTKVNKKLVFGLHMFGSDVVDIPLLIDFSHAEGK
ncbi:hypothetical protein HDC90_002562 [Pedobacter sp. AK013]|nr:hypothetical protein [Pedobacter sp. AK013]